MDALFALDLIVANLGSGSRGNCTYIGDERAGVLIDCGISTRQINERLSALGLAPRIDAVLITHEHSDHVGAAGVLDRHLRRAQGASVPFFMTPGTRGRLPEQLVPTATRLVSAGQPFQHLAWQLEPHAVPHDTPDPVAWVVEAHGARAGVLTDLGHAPRAVELLLAGLDVAVVEFNHDEEMLMAGPYPWPLKQRIRGRHGHLSNRQAARLLRRAGQGRLKHVLLGHLSEENNTPEHALISAEQALQDGGANGVIVHVAQQRKPLGPLRIKGRSVAVSSRAKRKRAPAPQVAPSRQPSLFD